MKRSIQNRTHFVMKKFVPLSAMVAILWMGLSSCSKAEMLTIGSVAPAISVEHWVHNGEGRFPKVETFEPGKVYIVEFWATWCGPCIASMPHMVEIQSKYADMGVQLISVSDEQLEIVEKFLDKKIPNAKEDEPTTYGELTKSYCLTADPDRSVHKDYMTAAERHGIPCCFIVGKDAKIEWIGHPMRLDEPLDQVVNGTWDRESFGTQFRIDHAREELMYQTRIQIAAATRDKDYAKIIEIADASLSKADTDDLKFDFMAMKLPAMAKASVSPLEIEKVLSGMLGLTDGLSPISKSTKILSASRLTYDLYVNDQVINKELGEKAKSLVSLQANSLPAITKATALDTLAHLQFVTGDLAGAIASQKQAVELSTGKRKEVLQEFLDELKSTEEEGTAKKKGSQ